MASTLERSLRTLPVQLTSFIGRSADLAAVGSLVEDARLVTLTGPGGAGKTRLAEQAARARAKAFPDGVWWVELADVGDAAGVVEAVAADLGVALAPAPAALRSLTAQLAERRALVCLDNAEHLVEAVAEFVDAVLRAGPTVTVLVTSREPLSVPGEVVWRVPPLEDEDAVRLFVERARAIQPSFVLDASSEAAVRSIALHLDGIPLALELAAAWLGTLSPQQILAGLDDRFRLLIRGPRGAQRRQQTLAGSIGWSHALLDPVDRAVFRRLAVFAGPFGLDAALTMGAGDPVPADEVLPALGRLVDKSLVMAEAHDGVTRYRLLETIRVYAAARLTEAGESTAIHDRHLAWSVAFAEDAEAELERDLDTWRARIEPEQANLRAALEWGLAAPDPEPGRRLAASLAWTWHLDRRGREGLAALRTAVARAPDDRSPTQARLLAGIALVADSADPLDLEYDAADRALVLATELGDESLRALCLALKAVGAFYTDFDEAWALCDAAISAAEASGHGFARAGSRALQAIVLHLRNRHEAAAAAVEEVLPTLLRRHRGVAATLLAFRAEGMLAVGDVAGARATAEQATCVAAPLGDYLRVGTARSTTALIQGLTGDLDGAIATIEPDLRLIEGPGEAPWVPGLARTMGVLCLHRGDAAGAVEWFEREVRSTDRGAETWLAAQALPGLGAALVAAGRTSEAGPVLERAEAVARRFAMPSALAEALDARAALAADDPGAALDLHHAALAERAEHGLRASLPVSLERLAAAGARSRPSVDQVRLLGAADVARSALGLPRGGLDAAVGADLGQDDAAAAAWSAGREMTLDDAVAYARRSRGKRARPSTGWASLTPTELEVVALVAEGLTNPQIGARLFISRGTVKTHLGHIFAKLAVTTRTELATLAAGRGHTGGP